MEFGVVATFEGNSGWLVVPFGVAAARDKERPPGWAPRDRPGRGEPPKES